MANQPVAPNLADWVIQPCARGTRSPIFTQIGKHFGRAIHQTIPLSYIMDEARTCLELQRANPANLEAPQNLVYQKYYHPIRLRIGPSLDDSLLGDVDWAFQTKATAEFREGHSQGRSDDLVTLKRVVPEHRLLRHLPVGHLRGFSTDEYANLLKTPDLNLNDPETRPALNTGIIDVPSNQLYAGLYAGYVFPDADAHPLHGLFRSELFVDAWLGVFHGPRAARHLEPGSGGRRSKASKNNMTQVTKALIAYIAMILRFVLHQSTDSWYSIESNLDTRYNYAILYTEALNILEEPLFGPQVDGLLHYLNGLIFPRVHRRPANTPTNAGPSSHERALARVLVLT